MFLWGPDLISRWAFPFCSWFGLNLGKQLQYMVCIQRRSVAPLRTASWGRNLVLSGGAGLKLICPGYQGGGTWARCCGVAPLMASDGIEQHVVGVPWDEFCSNPPLRYLLKHLKCFQLSLNVCSQELLCLEVVTSSRNSHWWCKITWQHLWENNYIGKRLFWDFFFVVSGELPKVGKCKIVW